MKTDSAKPTWNSRYCPASVKEGQQYTGWLRYTPREPTPNSLVTTEKGVNNHG